MAGQTKQFGRNNNVGILPFSRTIDAKWCKISVFSHHICISKKEDLSVFSWHNLKLFLGTHTSLLPPPPTWLSACKRESNVKVVPWQYLVRLHRENFTTLLMGFRLDYKNNNGFPSTSGRRDTTHHLTLHVESCSMIHSIVLHKQQADGCWRHWFIPTHQQCINIWVSGWQTQKRIFLYKHIRYIYLGRSTNLHNQIPLHIHYGLFGEFSMYVKVSNSILSSSRLHCMHCTAQSHQSTVLCQCVLSS